jgi:hypothetical protein
LFTPDVEVEHDPLDTVHVQLAIDVPPVTPIASDSTFAVVVFEETHPEKRYGPGDRASPVTLCLVPWPAATAVLSMDDIRTPLPSGRIGQDASLPPTTTPPFVFSQGAAIVDPAAGVFDRFRRFSPSASFIRPVSVTQAVRGGQI